MVDAAVALHNFLFIESGFLKLSVYIGGKDEPLLFALRQTQKHAKSIMGLGITIQMQPVTVKSPRQCRVRLEPEGVCQLHKTETQPLCRGIGPPEPLVPSEIRQP